MQTKLFLEKIVPSNWRWLRRLSTLDRRYGIVGNASRTEHVEFITNRQAKMWMEDNKLTNGVIFYYNPEDRCLPAVDYLKPSVIPPKAN